MARSEPSLEQWRRLYALATAFRDLAPWQWMEEVDLFGVQQPQTGEVGFVSVMGKLGEHFAASLYLGAASLYSFWNMEQSGPDEAPERLLEIPQLQLSFEDRGELMKQDRAVIKELGLKFRGAQAWPLFRSYRPGFFPWLLEAEEAEVLGWALEQLVEVAPRFREDQTLRKELRKQRYLIRVPEQEGDTLVWHDVIGPVEPPESPSISIEVSNKLMEAIRRLPQGNLQVEADFWPAPVRIGKAGERPQVGYMLLVVEARNGFVVGQDVLTAEPSLEAMYGSVPGRLLQSFVPLGMRPSVVNVRSPLLASLLTPVAGVLGMQIKRVRRLPALAEAQAELDRFLGS